MAFFKTEARWTTKILGKGNKKRASSLAHFLDVSGKPRKYNLSSLLKMQTNPPKQFNDRDHEILGRAIRFCPKNDKGVS